METQPILDAMEEVRGLMADKANEEAAAKKFEAVTDQVMELMTMYTLADIRSYQDATNESYVAESEYMNTA